MRVYVASKFENQNAVKKAMHMLRQQGHFVTHDWTVENADGLEGTVRDDYLAHCAQKDVDGVQTAEAILLLHQPNMRGAYIELGIALGRGKRVFVVDGLRDDWTRIPIFYRLPHVIHVASVEDAVEIMTAMEL